MPASSLVVRPRYGRFAFAGWASALLLCALPVFAAGPTGLLNDTGITFCGDATTNTANCATVGADGGTFPRQDALNGRDAQAAARTLTKVGGGGAGFDFSKIDNNGSVTTSTTLGTGATDWACTRDNVTGLIWEVKTTSGLRSMSHTYSWYNNNPATNGGSAGTPSLGTCFATGRCDTEKYVQDVNEAGLCGAGDAWRMPSVKELEGIADLGRTNPAIDSTYFPNTPSSGFWSGSPYSNSSGTAWGVFFDYGEVDSSNRSAVGAVRLVRGGHGF